MKTPGQIAYEAMLTQCEKRGILRKQEFPPIGDAKQQKAYDYLNGIWDEQPDELREDWEAIAAAVLRARREMM